MRQLKNNKRLFFFHKLLINSAYMFFRVLLTFWPWHFSVTFETILGERPKYGICTHTRVPENGLTSLNKNNSFISLTHIYSISFVLFFHPYMSLPPYSVFLPYFFFLFSIDLCHNNSKLFIASSLLLSES